ncbi:MAG: hypothetical protein NC131_16865 [Roseburia sp.]|nr:hypothetical protein [Roseburia sp.]
MNFLQRFMYGRNGLDSLGLFTMALYMAIYLVSAFTGWWPLYYVSSLLAFAFLFRVLSRNLPRRQKENAAFQRAFAPLTRWVRRRRLIRQDKAHRYLKCPNCHQQLRVPRGKGKLRVTCRACGGTFEAKT